MTSNSYHDPALWERVASAAAFAVAIHACQTCKGTDIPYISHLLGVAGLVLEHDGDEEQAVAGLLHDAIEDAGLEQEAVIAERFGPRVAAIVRKLHRRRHCPETRSVSAESTCRTRTYAPANDRHGKSMT